MKLNLTINALLYALEKALCILLFLKFLRPVNIHKLSGLTDLRNSEAGWIIINHSMLGAQVAVLRVSRLKMLQKMCCLKVIVAFNFSSFHLLFSCWT